MNILYRATRSEIFDEPQIYHAFPEQSVLFELNDSVRKRIFKQYDMFSVKSTDRPDREIRKYELFLPVRIG